MPSSWRQFYGTLPPDIATVRKLEGVLVDWAERFSCAHSTDGAAGPTSALTLEKAIGAVLGMIWQSCTLMSAGEIEKVQREFRLEVSHTLSCIKSEVSEPALLRHLRLRLRHFLTAGHVGDAEEGVSATGCRDSRGPAYHPDALRL